MKIQKILISFLFFIFSFFTIDLSYSAINMSISPIKYELTANTGATITKEAKLTNNTDKTIHIITGKSDFIAAGENGVPKFIRKSEEVFEQELSDWISIDTPYFDIAPGDTKTIHFTINVPDNATPGGHYGAIFFKNNNSEQSNGTSIGINIDYGVLILLNVNGDTITDIEIEEPIIRGNSGRVVKMDECNQEGGDKSGNYYDGKCNLGDNNNTNNGTISGSGNTEKINNGKENNIFDKIISEITGNIEELDLNTDNTNNGDNNFKVEIVIPVENKGNTHVKPTGEIILKDENGKQIKKVGKKIKTNKKGAIIGEEIVDYIPFNDEGGNVLPGTKRVFDSSWKGFPHQEINEDGEKEMFYWDPSEYYTRKNFEKKLFIYPWEKIDTRTKKKKITAIFKIKYPNQNGEEIEYNSAKDFDIEYKEKYVTINPYFFIGLALLILILFLIIKLIKKIFSKNKKLTKKPIIIAKKQKLKTKELELKNKLKEILINNKLKYAEDITKLTKKDLLKIKGIGEKAIDEIKKALKKEKMKLKK